MTEWPQTINGLFLKSYAERPDKVAFYTKLGDAWAPTTNAQSQQTVEEIGMGLADLEVNKGDAVAILMGCRPEWPQTDAAILGLGAITVGLYTTTTGEQMAYILEHSEANVLVAESPEMLAPLLPHLGALPSLRAIVLLDGAFDGDIPQDMVSLSELRQRGRTRLEARSQAWVERARAVRPSDIATYIYTSGTTGPPKGVILSHANFHELVQAIHERMPVEPGRVGIAFLPFAHSFQRLIAYQGARFGTTAYFAPSIDRVPETLQEVQPELFGAVPRILEKMYTRVHVKVSQGKPIQQKLFKLALGVGQRRATYIKAQQPVPWLLAKQFAVADRIVFSKIKAVLGGRVERVVSGGAPLAPHIAEFFLSIGMLVLEGYGLTETSAATTVNVPEEFKFGTVGKPIPGSSAKIADDGEVLLKGPGIFQGYLKDAEATRAAFTEDGWFCTGDIGTLDDEGFLTITDRKKQLIITAGGKNIAPQPIENQLKGIRWISNAYLHGDRRKYLIALLTLDMEEVDDHFRQSGRTTPERPAEDEELRRLVETSIGEVNQSLASYETIKRFKILPGDFTPEDGSLTPTLKLKRRVLRERYEAQIDELYTSS